MFFLIASTASFLFGSEDYKYRPSPKSRPLRPIEVTLAAIDAATELGTITFPLFKPRSKMFGWLETASIAGKKLGAMLSDVLFRNWVLDAESDMAPACFECCCWHKLAAAAANGIREHDGWGCVPTAEKLLAMRELLNAPKLIGGYCCCWSFRKLSALLAVDPTTLVVTSLTPSSGGLLNKP